MFFDSSDELRGLIDIVSSVLIQIFFALALAALIDVFGRLARRNRKLEALPKQGIQQTLKLVLLVITIV